MTPASPQSVWISAEVLGVHLRPGVVPWNNEKVHVEASLRLPPSARVAADFRLEIEASEPVAAMRLQPGKDGRHHLHFALAPRAESCRATVCWRSHKLQHLTIEVTSRTDYLASVTLRDAHVRQSCDSDAVVGTTFATKTKLPLMLVGTLTSAWPLLPLFAEELHLETSIAGTTTSQGVRLSAGNLTGTESLLTLPLAGSNRKAKHDIALKLDGRELYREAVHFVTPAKLEDDLVLVDVGFLVERDGRVVRTRKFPAGEKVSVAPFYRVRLRTRRAAWKVAAQIHAAPVVADGPRLMAYGETLSLTDKTTEVVGLFSEVERYAGRHEILLKIGDRTVGALPLSQIAQAVLDSEGGFAESRAFEWNAAAEAELQSRLDRLME